MKDEFRSWLDAFTATLTFANEPVQLAVWNGQVPMIFTTKMAAAATALEEVQAWCQKQSQDITGAAKDKKTERLECADAAFVIAQALVTYFLDQGDETQAEPFRRTEDWWRLLPGQTLLLRAQDVIDAATPLTTGAGAATIASNYGISAAAVADLVEERADFAAHVGRPTAARAGRKAYTAAMREKFRPVHALFRDLDRMVVQFRPRPNGPAFVDGWFAARNVIPTGGGGGGGGGEPEPPTLPTAPQDVVLTKGAEGSGDVSLAAATQAGVTEITVRSGTPGGEQTLVGTFTEMPIALNFTPGTELVLTLAYRNAAGEGPQSDPLTDTAP